MWSIARHIRGVARATIILLISLEASDRAASGSKLCTRYSRFVLMDGRRISTTSDHRMISDMRSSSRVKMVPMGERDESLCTTERILMISSREL